MGWFRQSFGQSKDSQRISDLEEGLEKASKALKALQLEWDLTYDKLRQLTGRLTKRAAILEASQPEEGPTEADTDGAPALDEPLVGLTKRQIEINNRILRSRRGGLLT